MTDLLKELERDLGLPGGKASIDKGDALQRRVNTLQQQVLDAGLDDALLEPRETLFSKVLDILDTPLQAVSGVVDSAFFEKDLGDVGLLGAIKRGTEQNIDPFELARKADIENPLARAVVGFGASMALDPLNLITGGAKGAAVAGGKALTKVGKEASGELLEKLVKGSVTQLDDGAGALVERAPLAMDEALNVIDDAFGGADQYRKSLKQYQTAREGVDGVKDPILAVSALNDLSKARNKLEPLLEHTDLSLDKLDDLFQDKGLKLELGVPLLGHLQGKKGRTIGKDANVLAKALTTAGNVLNPGTLSSRTITKKDVNKALDALGVGESFKDFYSEVKRYGDTSLSFLAKSLNKLEEVPIVGAPVSVGKGVASGVAKAMDTAKKGFQGTFIRKALYGPDYDRDRQLFLNYDAATADIATEQIEALYKSELLDPEQTPLLRQALIDIDSMVFDPVMELKNSGQLKNIEDKLLNNLNKMSLGVDFEDVELAKIPGLEDAFRRNLDNYMANPDVPNELKAVVQKTMSHFDELIEAERQAGIKVGFVETYVPHVYENAKEAILKDGPKRGGTGKGFLKKRTYRDLEQALTERPLVPELNLAKLAHYRTRQSLRLRGQKQFFNRVTMEHGMPLEQYTRLINEAEKNPEILNYLQRKQMPLPKYLTEEQLATRREVLERTTTTKNLLRKSAANNIREAAKKISPDGRLLTAQSGNRGVEAAQYVKNSINEAADIVGQQRAQAFKEIQYFGEVVDRKMYGRGTRPLDSTEPRALFGEIATEVNDKGQRIVLPTPIAKSYNETVSRRDALREIFPDSEGFQSFVDLADSGLNFVKKTVTWPFPAYWGRNLISDGLFRWMDGGINAIEPGLYPEVQQVLKGRAGLKLANGMVMDAATFKRILRDNGMNFNSNEFIDAINAASGTDIDRYLKKQKGFFKNIKEPGIALEVANQQMRDKFENFFRISHLAHRLKNGDTIRDAVFRTNEALINYRDLNEFERSFARRAYMFWGWTSKATKKAMTQLLTSPGDIQAQVHVARGVSEAFSGSDAPPTIEEFDKRQLKSLVSAEQVSFPLGRDKDGKIVTGRGFGLPVNALGENIGAFMPRNFSLTELTDTFSDSFTRTLAKQAAQTNPGLKIIAEKLSGKNLFFDKPLDSKFLRKLPEFESAAERIAPHPFTKIPAQLLDGAAKTFLKAVPDGEGNLIADPGRYYMLTSVIPGISRAVSSGRTLLRPETSVAQNITGFLTGVRVEGQDIERSQLYSQMENLNTIINRNSVKEILQNQEQ